MKTNSLTTSLLLAGVLVLPIPTAMAAVLGDVVTVSTIGEPFRVEIRAGGDRAGTLAECIRLRAPSPDDGVHAVRSGRVGVITRAGETRIVVTDRTPVFEPIVRIALEEACETRLSREYTLLLPYPGETAAPTADAGTPAAAPADTRPARATRAPRSDRTWITAPGESLDSLARALYPDDSALRRRFVAALRRDNPEAVPDATPTTAELPAGTTLAIPDLDRLAATAGAARARQPRRAAAETSAPASADRPSAAPPEPRAAQPASRTPRASGPESDRLVLATEAERGAARGALSAADDFRVREERLVAAIDRSINAQMELLERIRRLEEIQSALSAQLAQAERLSAAPRVVPPTSGSDARPALDATVPQAPPPATAAPKPASGRSGWTYLALFAALAAALAFVLPRLRRRANEPAPTQLAPEPSPRPAPDSAWASRVPAEPVTVTGPFTQGLLTSIPDPSLSSLDWDLTGGTRGSEKLAPIVLDEETAEEHESAIELAEIMMGFGRVHGAAETLAEFIHANPKQAVTPWLKLLEVYRAAGLRPEFDGLARQLNKTFNVKAVTWDTFDDARKTHYTLEDMPHVVEMTQKLWGTRECQAYLQKLLRDNRDGTRQGFPLAVIDEILMLTAVLDVQLGPYRPEEAAINAPTPERTA